MGSDRRLVVPLSDTVGCTADVVGGKAARLATLAATGARVPTGFTVTTWAYEAFVASAGLEDVIRMELDRKPLEEMRWEELWDAALRLRMRFRSAPLPPMVRESVGETLRTLLPDRSVTVRSSAVAEDSTTRSFAGLHESFIDVSGVDAVLDAVRLVWASLWSDAALLYRRELGLDPSRSRIAVLIQEFVESQPSGVAFGHHPSRAEPTTAVIEAVAGRCRLLVDGLTEPDHWEIDRATRRVLKWRPGASAETGEPPLLQSVDLDRLMQALDDVESVFSWAPDIEWTGTREALTLLQARPITTMAPAKGDKRAWYLTLRPSDDRLRQLRARVVDQLIPALEAEGARLVREELEGKSDQELADAIETRHHALERWRHIYWDEFIPFAHGVRRLATYYNDAVAPVDPYEFVGLLSHQPLLAFQRNAAFEELASRLSGYATLGAAVRDLLEASPQTESWSDIRKHLHGVDGGPEFLDRCEHTATEYLDITFDHVRLQDRPRDLLRMLTELSSRTTASAPGDAGEPPVDPAVLEDRLNAAVGPEHEAEARDVIETARISWKLRDDDNLLVARIESQLVRALAVAETRLRRAGQLDGVGPAGIDDVEVVVRALRSDAGEVWTLPARRAVSPRDGRRRPDDERPRQLVGQPASPGLATGRARWVRGPDDVGSFQLGEILICDAVQPTMTHLVPLAGGVVERRGGMLIHGAIIARELGIPCVNGVGSGAERLVTGDLLTVDGHLGIVSLGAPEFDLEHAAKREAEARDG